MINEIAIGIKIAEARRRRNLSQSQLAEMLMVTPQAVSKWERGESLPDILTLNRMTGALGVDLNYFSDAEPAAPNGATAAENDGGGPAAGQDKKPAYDMSLTNWSGADFAGLKNQTGKFSFSNIEKCGFAGADLAGCQFKGNNIERSNFTDAALAGGKFSMANIEGNQFYGASLKGASFSGCNVDKNDFTGADLSDTFWKSCNFDSNQMPGAKLQGASFKNCNLKVIVSDSTLANCSFIGGRLGRSEFRGVTFINCFFKNVKLKSAAFIGCRADKISYAFLTVCKADLSGIEKID